MAQVSFKTFLKPDKYKELIEKYNSILHTEKQIIYLFNSNESFRFMKTKRYCEFCINQDRVVKIDAKYTNNMSYTLNSLGYIPNVKWFRTRSEANLDFGMSMYLDYIVGYGYIIEVSKEVEENAKSDLTKIELGNFIESLDIDILKDEELSKKHEEYVLNWERLTGTIDEENFLR